MARAGFLTLRVVLVLLCARLGAGVFTRREMFEEWKARHGRSYGSTEEEARRFAIWSESLEMVWSHNGAGDRGYTLALNKFADVSWEEFKSTRLGASQNCSATQPRRPTAGAPHLEAAKRQPVPESIDWRDKGAVSPVKDQGNCGSCWTFSTTGALESAYFLRHGSMRLFSEQQLVDCAQGFDNHGCNGGLPSQAFEYLFYGGGIETEEDYPYKGKDQECQFKPDKAVGLVTSSVNITYLDERELEAAVGTVGPVSVAFQVSPDFKLYKEGVYDSRVCRSGPDNVNHAVLAVGYGKDEEGGPYWIVKNSWGTSWGMDGYFWMSKGQNMCGVSDCASYPLVA